MDTNQAPGVELIDFHSQGIVQAVVEELNREAKLLVEEINYRTQELNDRKMRLQIIEAGLQRYEDAQSEPMSASPPGRIV